MAKALTREDLLYILQSIFRISKESENAFSVLQSSSMNNFESLGSTSTV